MKLTFYGGVAEVTGSCTLVEAGGLKILVDCGAFQGGRAQRLKNNERLPFDAKSINAVILTHAHYDHCGRIPKLVASGFTGPIFSTAATAHMAKLVLEDSLKVMEGDYQKTGTLPFFNEGHLNQAFSQFKHIKYGQKVNFVGDQAGLVLHDAGHILGSSWVELHIDGKTAIFSGDLGNYDAPIIRDTEDPVPADVIVMESTYAMKEHEAPEERMSKLETALLDTSKNGGVLLIPSFAIERTQEILWELARLADQHKLPQMKIYLDSPLAIKASEDFSHHSNIFDKEALAAYGLDQDILDLNNVVLTRTTDESKTINHAPAPKVIIAGSGMMEGGRIMHHLSRYLPLPNTTVLVVGYQGEGTTGRKIVAGQKEVMINGRFVPVHAKIVKADSFSAHADFNKLTKWVTASKPAPRYVFLNHGEYAKAKDFAAYLATKFQLNVLVPKPGQKFTIT